MTHRTQRIGFSLMEVIAVLAGLSFLMYLSAVLLISTVRIRDASADAVAHQAQRALLIDQFRADVAEAVDAPASLGEWKAGPDCLILRHPNGRHILYRFEADLLLRAAQAARIAEPNWVAQEPALAAVEFHRGGPQQRQITLRLTPASTKLALDISASLGGDLR